MSYYNKYRPQTIAELDLKEVRDKLTKIFSGILKPQEYSVEYYQQYIVRDGKEVAWEDLTLEELLEERKDVKRATEQLIQDEHFDTEQAEKLRKEMYKTVDFYIKKKYESCTF